VDLKTIVEQARTRTSRGFCIESAAWDGGRLLPDSGTDKVLYYVTDHLGSTRVVKDGSGLSALSVSAIPYLDFGARLYSPGTAMWLSQDPLAEKYYPLTPYMYCAGSPGNRVDPTGEHDYFLLRMGHGRNNKQMIHLMFFSGH